MRGAIKDMGRFLEKVLRTAERIRVALGRSCIAMYQVKASGYDGIHLFQVEMQVGDCQKP
jgi:hypothetical protein